MQATGEAGQVTKRDRPTRSAAVLLRSRVRHRGSRGCPRERGACRAGSRSGCPQGHGPEHGQVAFTAPHVSIFVEVDATRTMEFVKRLVAVPARCRGREHLPAADRGQGRDLGCGAQPGRERHVVGHRDHREALHEPGDRGGHAAGAPARRPTSRTRRISLRELAVALQQLTSMARAGCTQPGDAGRHAVDHEHRRPGSGHGHPRSSIRGVGHPGVRGHQAEAVGGGREVVPRWITTLSGSFYYRVVDGGAAARFMSDVARIVEEPALAAGASHG
ncbi:2-oxo acid dehydrogenase subunit E2 [Kocuria rhizophila]|nr:2-oxo acid dehydrogenase subunit E2 [Kocuria rhizophila]